MLVLIMAVALFAAACGGSDDAADDLADQGGDPAADEQADEPSGETDASAAPGISDRSWSTQYEDTVRDAFDNASRTQQRDNCRQARRSTKDELITLFVGSAGNGTSNFETLMTELGIVPTDDDFTYAAGLAVDVIRDRCAEEFPALAEPLPEDTEDPADSETSDSESSDSDAEPTPLPVAPPDDY